MVSCDHRNLVAPTRHGVTWVVERESAWVGEDDGCVVAVRHVDVLRGWVLAVGGYEEVKLLGDVSFGWFEFGEVDVGDVIHFSVGF